MEKALTQGYIAQARCFKATTIAIVSGYIKSTQVFIIGSYTDVVVVAIS